MSRIATCTVCPDEPLVMTFQFTKREFICLSCGRLFEFFGPLPADETPALLAAMGAREAEWAAHELLNDHSWHLDTCSKCKTGGEYHVAHASDEEKLAHNAAVAWLTERTGREYGLATYPLDDQPAAEEAGKPPREKGSSV